MRILRSAADVYDPNSLSNRFRSRRFERFAKMVEEFENPVRIIDIGGTNAFWEQRGWAGRDDRQITLVNLEPEEKTHENITPTKGDATNLEGYADLSFDFAFSNSVIEHLFTLKNQKSMAREVRRVAKAYWVQTPNYWFPIEPHFHVPGWHWMPAALRIAIIRKRRCGWRGPCPDLDEARQLVREVRLMTAREMRVCFPGATIFRERFCGLTKSLVAHTTTQVD